MKVINLFIFILSMQSLNWPISDSLDDLKTKLYLHSREGTEQKYKKAIEQRDNPTSFYKTYITPILNSNAMEFIKSKLPSRILPNKTTPKYDLNQLKADLTKFISSLKWELELKDNKLYGFKTQNKIKQYLFKAKIEQVNIPTLNKVRQFIVIDNRPKWVHKDETVFDFFSSNHVVFKRQISENHMEAQSSFIDHAIKSIHNSYMNLESPKTPKNAAEYIQSLISNEKIDGLGFHKKYDITISFGFDLRTENGELVFQVILFLIGKNFIGAEFTLNDDTHTFFLPRDNFDAARSDLVSFLKEKKSDRVDSLVQFNSASKLIKDFIDSSCLKDKQNVKVVAKKYDFFIEISVERISTAIPTDIKDVCVFGESKIFLTLFGYGYLHYIHFYIQSSYMQKENMIPIAANKFSTQLTDAMKSISEIINEIKILQAEATTEVKLTQEGLENILNSAMGSQGTPVEVPKAKRNSADKLVLILNYEDSHVNVEIHINKEGYLIRMSKKVGISVSPNSTEITVPVVNAYDQTKSITRQVKDYLVKENIEKGNEETSKIGPEIVSETQQDDSVD